MESSVRKELSDRILKDLSSDQVKKTRKQLQGARPQVLFLDDLKFINDTIKELIDRGHITKDVKNVSLSKKNLTRAREIAKPFQDSYIKRKKRYKGGANNIENTMGGIHLKNKFPDVFKKVLEGEAFVLSSFAQVGKCKKKIIEEFVDATEDQIKEITKRVDRGHGAGDGLAVSAVSAARAFGRVDKALGEDKEAIKEFGDAFDTFLENAFETGEIDAKITDDIKSLRIDYKQVVTEKGEVSATYVPFIEFQDKYTNRVTDKAREVEVKNLIEKFFAKVDAGEIVALQGSSPLRDKVFAAAISNIIDIKVKGRKVKVTLDKNVDPRKVKLKTKGKAESKSKVAKGGGSLKRTAVQAAATIPRGRRKESTQNTLNIKTLLGIMNSRINDVVAKNMGPPRLENRTGTFAGSVRITDVTQTRQGHPSIGYTYRKDPYQVFEASSGTRFSSAARDPRPLIDASIREIAAQFALGRLYTRRI